MLIVPEEAALHDSNGKLGLRKNVAYCLSFCLSLPADPVVQIEGNPHCCFFNFSPKIMFTKVVKAQLWVYLRPVQHTSTVYLQILRLKPVTEDGSRHIRIRSLKIDLNSRIGHWQSIDFKHVLQNWFKQPQNNWGIEINAFDPNGNDLAVTSLGPGAEGLVGKQKLLGLLLFPSQLLTQ